MVLLRCRYSFHFTIDQLQDDTIVDTYWLVGSSCIDKGLDIFNSNQNKKAGGVLNKRIKQEQIKQEQINRDDVIMPPPYDDNKPMMVQNPAASGGGDGVMQGHAPLGQDQMTTGHGAVETGQQPAVSES